MRRAALDLSARATCAYAHVHILPRYFHFSQNVRLTELTSSSDVLFKAGEYKRAGRGSAGKVVMAGNV